MPRKAQYDDDDMPRRGSRRGAADQEHGLAMRIFLHSPKDVVAGGIACAAVIAIITNALFLQAGRHPAPMFGAAMALPANPLPKPRPADADPSLPETRSADPRTADPLGNLLKTTNSVPPMQPNIPRPPAAVPLSHVDTVVAFGIGSRRIAALQRALSENGYGQLKPDGVVGSDTQVAIQKFERARRLPITGQVSDRLMRELAAVTGHPIE